ncbi:MAG: hypothetical protein HYU29_08580 [Chloroflexi bacterium]|nr:hypothetical protein [Chloroflexota bacterium]
MPDVRSLLYVPVLHAEADMGHLGHALAQRAAQLVGEKRWASHREFIYRFWQAVSDYFLALDLKGLRIYQDGLAVDGEVGQRVVEEGARRGSPNYQLLRELLRHGAVLQKTEDPGLLLQEQQNIKLQMEGGPVSVTRETPSRPGPEISLLEARDRFIAGAINHTLREGHVGALFLGAHHEVIPLLDPDILVDQVKPQAQVKSYFHALLHEADDARWLALGESLCAPVVGR